MIEMGPSLSKLKDWCKYKIRSEWEIYLLLVVVGFWYFLNTKGAMGGDEPIHAFNGFFYWQGNFSHVPNRPLGMYLIGLGEVLFGRTTTGAKLFPPLFGIGAVYLVYRITKELSHRFNGFFAALIAATIPSFASLCVQALLDVFFIFFSLLLFYLAVKYSKAEKPEKKQFYILSMGVVSVFIFTTKLEGIIFIAVIFFYILYKEWGNIKNCEILRPRGALNKLGKKRISLPIFLILGVLFGLILRWQLSLLWDQAGADSRKELLGAFGLLGGILKDLNGNPAMIFFVVMGIIISLILWVIYGLLGVEMYRTLKTMIKREKLDSTHQILLYPIGVIISAIITYLPFLLTKPGSLFFKIFIESGMVLIGGRSTDISVAGSVQGEVTPLWAYFYWIYEYLGWMFVIGITISIIYTVILIVERKKTTQKYHLLLFLYAVIPLLLYSLVSKRHPKYLVPLAALFSIYMATHLPKLILWILTNSKLKNLISRLPKKFPRYVSYAVLPLLLIIPGSFQMAINDPDVGYDSGYDDAARIVLDYAEESANETTYVLADDKIALEFYLPYPLPSNILIIPFQGGNWSLDDLGRPYRYYPEEEVYDMLLNGTIDLAVDEPPNKIASSDYLLRQYIYTNNTAVQEINEDLAVYYL